MAVWHSNEQTINLASAKATPFQAVESIDHGNVPSWGPAVPPGGPGSATVLVTSVDFVAGGPRREDPGGMQVGQDVHGQRRFGLEHHMVGYRGSRPPARVIRPLAGQIRPCPDKSMPTHGGKGGVHDVDRVGDPTRTADILAFDAAGGFALLLLPRLVQHHHSEGIVTRAQMLRDEPGHHPHRGVLVPHRVVEQPLRLVRTGITGPLRDLPPVLARHLSSQRTYVLARLQPRLPPGEHRPDTPQQLVLVLPGQLTGGYHARGGRLVFSLIHNHAELWDGRPSRKATRRTPALTPPRSGLEVRLPY